ncbi:MAG: YlxR family protein [Clostridia bacterium]|nr:YlxR family protein [Clostridia bacterium]
MSNKNSPRQGTMIKKTPMRMCIGCHQMFAKNTLIRVVKNGQGEVIVDVTGKANGRGAYLCKNAHCLATCIKNKALARHLDTTISQQTIDSIQTVIVNLQE